MLEILFDFLLKIPETIANFSTWLTSPIHEKYVNISPLALLGIGGTGIIIALIIVHIVKLFL